jgi:hypothetical protein
MRRSIIASLVLGLFLGGVWWRESHKKSPVPIYGPIGDGAVQYDHHLAEWINTHCKIQQDIGAKPVMPHDTAFYVRCDAREGGEEN